MSEEIVAHAELEIQALAQVADALRASITWQIKPNQLRRKISSVRFLAQSYQRYAERLFAIEEHDGYMDAVLQSHPQRTQTVERLRKDHEKFRQTIRRITTHLEHLAPEEQATFESLCRNLLALLENVENHNAHEIALLQDAFSQDEGGEA